MEPNKSGLEERKKNVEEYMKRFWEGKKENHQLNKLNQSSSSVGHNDVK